MKSVVRGRSGREVYGPKWQNTESTSSQNEEVDALHLAELPDSAAQPTVATVIDNEDETQALKGINRSGSLSNSHESMYRATLEGDCVAAEMLLERIPSLSTDEITEEGDRALHVAAAMKHKELVLKLVEKMSPSDLELQDGHGYTACCYAAIADVEDIVASMIRKNPTLASARDRENKTPIYKAAFRGNAKTVSYLLKSTKVQDLSMEEWFDLLLVTIRRKMYDVALEICGSNEQLATMRNDEGTALHLLARQRFFKNRLQWSTGVMRQEIRLLANKLWEGIQRLGKASVVEILKNPPILHYAAEEGNVELITMLTQTYPNLVWHKDNHGYTIFHIAVKYRQRILFGLINEIGARKDLIAASQDENGNNILHLAAELGPRDAWYNVVPTFRLRQEVLWFEEVQKIVPPLCREMINKDGQTPSKLFFKEHKSLLERNATWTINTANSWMLISTLIFTVVFASAFAVPGGYNQDTGIPLLFKSNWFTCFVIFEALAMFFSASSVFYFSWTLMSSDNNVTHHMPRMFKYGLILLSLSVFSAISAFMSAYFLIFVGERAALVTSVIVIVYSVLAWVLFCQNFTFDSCIPRRLFPKRNGHSLFKRHAYTPGWREYAANLLHLYIFSLNL